MCQIICVNGLRKNMGVALLSFSHYCFQVSLVESITSMAERLPR